MVSLLIAAALLGGTTPDTDQPAADGKPADTAPPVDQTRIAVLPPKLLRGARAVVDPVIFNEALLTATHDAGPFEVIGHSDMNAVLGFERRKQIVGCDDTVCFTEIGGALGVEYLLDTKVGRSGSRWAVTTKLIAIAQGAPQVRSRSIVHVDAEPETLLDSLPFIVEEILVDGQLPVHPRPVDELNPSAGPATIEDVIAGIRSDAVRLAPCVAAGRATGELRPGIQEIKLVWVVDARGRVRLAHLEGPPQLVASSVPSCFAARVRLQIFPDLEVDSGDGLHLSFLPYLRR